MPLVAGDDGRVGIYARGPTFYNRIHVGNARPFVVFSWLKRFLEHEGRPATFVANITDVNDKISDAARERGVPSEQLAREMTATYLAAPPGRRPGRVAEICAGPSMGPPIPYSVGASASDPNASDSTGANSSRPL